MKTFFAISIFLCILGLVVFVAMRRNEASLNGAEIHRKCDELWREKKFNRLHSYIDELHRDQNDYLPARLAYIQSLKRFGGRFEDMVREQIKLRAELDVCFPLVSPVFMEIYEMWMVQTMNASRSYQERGVSYGQRLKQMDPRHKTTFHFPQKWGVESLFILSPPLLLSERRLVESLNKKECVYEGTVSEAKEALAQILIKHNVDLPMLKRGAKNLVQARFQHGGLQEVAANLMNFDSFYTFDISAAVLIRGGAESIPVILSNMQFTTSQSDNEVYLWLLARIGILGPEVRKGIEACIDTYEEKEDLRSAHIVAYAHRVLDYLESLNRNSANTAQGKRR